MKPRIFRVNIGTSDAQEWLWRCQLFPVYAQGSTPFEAYSRWVERLSDEMGGCRGPVGY